MVRLIASHAATRATIRRAPTTVAPEGWDEIEASSEALVTSRRVVIAGSIR
jgi:hypothetical protein